MKPYFVTHKDEVSIHGCVEVWFHTFLISVQDAGEGSASRLGHFISVERADNLAGYVRKSQRK